MPAMAAAKSAKGAENHSLAEGTGGRVLTATSYGRNISEAAALSYKALEDVHFDGMYFRREQYCVAVRNDRPRNIRNTWPEGRGLR